jgi:hypothetical protein
VPLVRPSKRRASHDWSGGVLVNLDFFESSIDRQLLFWEIVTRRQLEHWEHSVAEIVRLGLQSTSLPGSLVWLAEADRHLVFVAARNLLRAAQLEQEALFDQGIAENITNVRDLLEHGEQNMPVFNVSPQRGIPPRQSGRNFSAQHPGKSPFSSFAWNSDDGPVLAPELPAWLIHESLNRIEALVIRRSPQLEQYVPERAASPWFGKDFGKDRWWPKPSPGP